MNRFVSLIRRCGATNNFDELHHGNRIHEVHANDLVRPLRNRSESGDRYRRCIGSENRILLHDRIQRFEHLTLDLELLGDCLDDDDGVAQIREVLRRANAANNRFLVRGDQSFFIDITLQALVDGLHPAGKKFFRNVAHHHVEASARGYLSNAIAHRARAHYTEDFIHKKRVSFSARTCPRSVSGGQVRRLNN
jgi:hypothetical protein